MPRKLPSLTKEHARHLLLAAQGLCSRPAVARKRDVRQAIIRMGVLQIDTIHVVARSPYLVLWSRLGNYDPAWLDELLTEGKIFEYWAHEACFIPTEDYGLFRHRMIDKGSMGWRYSREWVLSHATEVRRVLEHISERGAARSIEFARTDGKKSGGWWEWKPEKRALEMLFTAGELMVTRRHNFQRVYDLRERVLAKFYPQWNESSMPGQEETRRQLMLKAVKALGVTKPEWAHDYFRTKRQHTGPTLQQLASSGELLEVDVEGWEMPGLVHPENLPLLRKVHAGSIRHTGSTLLSPFDPVVWDRKRAFDLFDFDYRLECYTPAPKRRYGYFTLPVLHNGQLIGRLDAKAHRKESIMEIRALHIEAGIALSRSDYRSIAQALIHFAEWHGTPQVVLAGEILETDRHALTQALQQES